MTVGTLTIPEHLPVLNPGWPKVQAIVPEQLLGVAPGWKALNLYAQPVEIVLSDLQKKLMSDSEWSGRYNFWFT